MNRLTKRTKNGPLPVLVRDRAFGPAFFFDFHLEERDYNDYRDALEKLARYEDSGLEPEQINCVNTNVYVNWRDDVFNDSGTEQLTIDSVGFMTHDGTFYAFDEIGKTVFPTREDAEKALEGTKNDE